MMLEKKSGKTKHKSSQTSICSLGVLMGCNKKLLGIDGRIVSASYMSLFCLPSMAMPCMRQALEQSASEQFSVNSMRKIVLNSMP